jgi:high-affinity iron transporter
MLDAVMLVLREVLEAVLFVSLLLALGVRLRMRSLWAGVAVPLGLLGSWGLSLAAYPLAAAFDGTGQELMNAALYALAIGCFVTVATLLVPELPRRDAAAPPAGSRLLYACFVLIVAASIAREGSEVWIYLSSFRGAPKSMSAAVVGGLIGTGIGLSLCTLVYYAFAFLGRRVFLGLFVVLSTFVVGGLSMQLARQGLQIGWLDSGQSIWNTTWLVDERSWLGQLLHALFGYDANPDTTQALFWFGALFAVALGASAQLLRRRSHA